MFPVIIMSWMCPFLGTESRDGSGRRPLSLNSSEGLSASPDSFTSVSQDLFPSPKGSLQCVTREVEMMGFGSGDLPRGSCGYMDSLNTHTCAQPAGSSFSTPCLLSQPIQAGVMSCQSPLPHSARLASLYGQGTSQDFGVTPKIPT